MINHKWLLADLILYPVLTNPMKNGMKIGIAAIVGMVAVWNIVSIVPQAAFGQAAQITPESESQRFSFVLQASWFEDTVTEGLQQDGLIVTNYQPFVNGTILVQGVVQ